MIITGGAGAAAFGMRFLGDDDIGVFVGSADSRHQSADAATGDQHITVNWFAVNFDHKIYSLGMFERVSDLLPKRSPTMSK